MTSSAVAESDLPLVLHTRVVTGTGGGPEKTILNSPRFLRELGYQCKTLYLHPPGDEGIETLRQKADAWQCSMITVPDQGLFDLSVIRNLLRTCQDLKVTVWHAHDYKTNALGLLLRRFHKMKLVTTVHGWVHHTSKTPMYYWIDRQCLRFYDRVLCVSEDLHQECLQLGIPETKCTLIDNAIDTEEFRRSQRVEDAKRALGLDPECQLIGAVGRLAEEKGFDKLIAAVDQLIQSGRNLQLAIIGEGSERNALEEQISRTSQPERFHLFGYQSNAIPFYEAMDLYVLSSLREGLPNVLLEAMSLEVPVVATKIAGVPKLIEDGVNGRLVTAGNVDELQHAISEVLANPHIAAGFVVEGRQTIESRFSFAHRMQKVKAVYDDLLG